MCGIFQGIPINPNLKNKFLHTNNHLNDRNKIRNSLYTNSQ
ncbi:hypothetical protein LEP1GSC049_3286 [Leptospira kirschneri serovar Cynopteri str. 3522 CT]|nr:hypothetical protein LEP1GSC049_3286 [Leptospira kirschneri serovar Cynopteri str. 3522 CT]